MKLSIASTVPRIRNLPPLDYDLDEEEITIIKSKVNLTAEIIQEAYHLVSWLIFFFFGITMICLFNN